MNLYQIDKEIESIYENAVDMETGEISADVIERLDELQMEREHKIENVALWHKNTPAEYNALDNEIKALQERKKGKGSLMDWQKKYLLHALNGEKFETSKVALGFRKSEVVEIKDENAFIDCFKENESLVSTKIEYKPNKAEIKKFVKGGGFIPGVELVVRQNLQIK